jgi:hypothetical protein
MACVTAERWPYWIEVPWFPDDYDIFLATQLGKCAGRQQLTKEEFLRWFPMFADAPEERIDMLIEKARTVAFNARIWGRWLKWGQALFVAHYLALWEMKLPTPDEGEDNGGWQMAMSGVSSFQAGSVRYTKDTSIEAKMLADPWLQTTFGQQLMDLLRSQIAVGLVMVT